MKVAPALQDLFALQARYGMNNRALATYAGYDEATLSKWHNGIQGASVTALDNFAGVFGHEVRLVPKPVHKERPIYLPKFLKVRP